MSTGVYDKLRTMIGQDQPEIAATEEVCKSMIRHWCEAMEDANPLYTDEDYARNSKYGNIIAPPVMIWTWILPPLWPPKARPEIWGKILQTCTKGGFDQIIDTDIEMQFYRPLFPGDRVSAMTKVQNVTKEKQTSLGRGHFVTLESTYCNQRAELVCVQCVTLLIYRARGSNEV